MKTKTKQCSKCLQRLPATTEYFSKSYNLQGLQSKCKKCNVKESTRYNYKKEEHVSWMNGDSCIYM